MFTTCSHCWAEIPATAPYCPSCRASQTDASSISVINRLPSSNSWRAIDLNVRFLGSTDQQIHYDRLIALLLNNRMMFSDREKIKLEYKNNPQNYINNFTDIFLKNYMPTIEGLGVQTTTASMAFSDYLNFVILSDTPITHWVKPTVVRIPVFESWPPTGKPKAQLILNDSGLELEGKKTKNTSLYWNQISSLGFGESQYHYQQGRFTTHNIGLTITIRVLNGAIYERHLLFGSKEAEINDGRVFVRQLIDSIKKSSWPVMLINDNGYNATGGYSVGVGVWLS